MDRTDLIKKIKAMGFSDYEARCYLAMFERETLTVSEVANIAKIPRPNTYDALEKLQSEGLIVLLPGKVMKFSAVDPTFLQEKQLEDLYRSTKSIEENIETVVERLGTFYKKSRGNGNPLDYVEILKNRDQIHRRKIQLCSEAQSEILGFSKPPFATIGKKLIKELDNAFEEAVHRGVKLRSIHQLPTEKSKVNKLFKWINERYEPEYEEIRLSKNLPMKLGIFDEKIVLLTLEYPVLGELSLTSLVIKHPDMAQGQKEMFESYWSKGNDHYTLGGRKYYLSRDKTLKDEQNRVKE